MQLDAVLDSSFDGLWICDEMGKVIRINRASEKINSIKAEQVLNKTMKEIVAEGLIDRSATLEVLRTRAAVTMIQNLKNGKQILVTGNPVLDKNGEISLTVVNERDITELNKLRGELERSRALSEGYCNELSHLHRQDELVKDVVIRSEIMKRLFGRAMRVAEVDSIVLIEGESGVGKGLFARIIHKASKRKDGPFIRVDCSAIPESLIESELFGYEGGAFTGARAGGKPGHFEMANGGSLFIDEVGELHLSTQVKLLRFIEESEVVAVGGTSPKKIDARIIAATNRNLDHMVNDKEFRRDLFFRLNVIPMRIPPLRERTEDIPPLILFYLKKFNEKFGTKKTIGTKVLDLLRHYSFPGNIRELANIIEQLLVLSTHSRIGMDDLPSHLFEDSRNHNTRCPPEGWNLRQTLDATEKNIILKALKEFGSQRKAAKHLGINQSTLARKAKRYAIVFDAKYHHDEAAVFS